MGTKETEELSASPAQLCSESKAALKHHFFNSSKCTLKMCAINKVRPQLKKKSRKRFKKKKIVKIIYSFTSQDSDYP